MKKICNNIFFCIVLMFLIVFISILIKAEQPTTSNYEKISSSEKTERVDDTSSELTSVENSIPFKIENTQDVMETLTEESLAEDYLDNEQQKTVKENIVSKIDPKTYTQKVNCGNLNNSEIELFNRIVEGYSLENTERFQVNENMLASYYRIENYAAIYFGNMNFLGYFCDFAKIGNEGYYIEFRVDDYKQIKLEKDYIDTQIDLELSKLNEGSEVQKLKQISDWFCHNVKYNASVLKVYDLFIKNEGNCNACSLTFKMFCERIGIKCDFLVGNSSNGYHAWNRVYFSDGRIAYYDIAYYMSSHNENFLNQISLPHEIVYENTYNYGGCG